MDEDTLPLAGTTFPVQPTELLGKLVYDVDGEKLGRVVGVQPVDGPVRRFEVELTAREARELGARNLLLDAGAIVATDNEVTLNDTAVELLHPELRREGILPPGTD